MEVSFEVPQGAIVALLIAGGVLAYLLVGTIIVGIIARHSAEMRRCFLDNPLGFLIGAFWPVVLCGFIVVAPLLWVYSFVAGKR